MGEHITAADIPEGEDEDTFSYHPGGEADKDKSTESPAENNQDEADPSPEGEKKNTQEDPDKDTPFHEHPRWKEREDEWTKRFNDQETRHQETLKQALDGIRDEFKEARKENKEQVAIPEWFGGTQEQWNAYRADRDKELLEAEERAEKRALDKFESKKTEESKAKESEETRVKEATEYMQAELKVLETDKTLNPDALKVDPTKLVQYTIDNMLIDAQGRWDYRKAFRFMKAEGLIKPGTTVSKDRKELADATVDKESKGEPSPQNFKTSKDFKKNRPW